MCVYLYLAPETDAKAQQCSLSHTIPPAPPTYPPPSPALTRRQQKAGQSRLKVQEMRHDRTTPTYASVTVRRVDE